MMRASWRPAFLKFSHDTRESFGAQASPASSGHGFAMIIRERIFDFIPQPQIQQEFTI
jgi:hypothetical protein